MIRQRFTSKRTCSTFPSYDVAFPAQLRRGRKLTESVFKGHLKALNDTRREDIFRGYVSSFGFPTLENESPMILRAQINIQGHMASNVTLQLTRKTIIIKSRCTRWHTFNPPLESVKTRQCSLRRTTWLTKRGSFPRGLEKKTTPRMMDRQIDS